MLGYMAAKKGPRGSRSPCPEWWVAEANRRLQLRGLTKKQLARALAVKGLHISEMMVIRCLLDDPHDRIPTVEAITAISRALGIPQPVVVAASMEQARELEALVAFTEVDAKMLALAAEMSDERSDAEPGKAVYRRDPAVDDGGTGAPAARSATLRRPPRAR